VIPVSNVIQTVAGGPVTVNRNIVNGVNSPGQIWVIKALKAEVSNDGQIKVRGRGLLLGGGNGIGTNANQKVFATLFCGGVAHSTATNNVPNGVPLEANGDFRIDDVLDNLPLPDPCTSPILLIRSTGGSWFAAGIVKHDEDK